MSKNQAIKPKNNFNSIITVPGDKSISHRAVMFGSLALGDTIINGFLDGEDCMSTVACFKAMGIDIENKEGKVIVHGKGLRGLSKPNNVLYVGNSGTTLRLMSGILSGQNFSATLNGDSSIQKRPMDRVALPLRLMGGEIISESQEKCLAPILINGKSLRGIEYELPVASAQVKSAIILASLYAKGETTIIEPVKSRDHTEIMLKYMGANIERVGDKIICKNTSELYGKEITVPGDISSAAFFMAIAALSDNSSITIRNVGINPTRTGFITVLKNMGGNVSLSNERKENGEDIADITVKSSNLKGVEISGDIIPLLIDEIPIIAVLASLARGRTTIKDASELKVKESNRIKTMTDELNKMGASIKETNDGMIIDGVTRLKGAICQSYNDHRVAMSISVAGLFAEGVTTILDSDCVDISFPGFYGLLESL